MYVHSVYVNTQPWTISSSDDLRVLSSMEDSVSPSTDVFYICQHYSLVFVLDMTPTMIQVVGLLAHSVVMNQQLYTIRPQTCVSEGTK